MRNKAGEPSRFHTDAVSVHSLGHSGISLTDWYSCQDLSSGDAKMRGLFWIAVGTPQARANLSNGSLGLEGLLHPDIAPHIAQKATAKGKVHILEAMRR
jgi:hypothetical protein